MFKLRISKSSKREWPMKSFRLLITERPLKVLVYGLGGWPLFYCMVGSFKRSECPLSNVAFPYLSLRRNKQDEVRLMS